MDRDDQDEGGDGGSTGSITNYKCNRSKIPLPLISTYLLLNMVESLLLTTQFGLSFWRELLVSILGIFVIKPMFYSFQASEVSERRMRKRPL